MAEDFKVWKVNYSFRVEIGERAGTQTSRNSYLVIARDEEEAFVKADGCYVKTGLAKEIFDELIKNGHYVGAGAYLDNFCRQASEYKRKIKIPQFDFESDSQDFSLEPKITEDGLSLEFIVKKNSE